jgi:hypothetical protein
MSFKELYEEGKEEPIQVPSPSIEPTKRTPGIARTFRPITRFTKNNISEREQKLIDARAEQMRILQEFYDKEHKPQ